MASNTDHSCCIVWFTGLGLLIESGIAYKSSTTNDFTLANMWAQGVGTVNPDNTTDLGTNSLTANILLANAMQLIVSFVYIFYNNVFTCMLLGHEYNQFAVKRKPLRVSRPKGQQRSTYFLSLPYRYSIPLMTSIGALHWLIARSIFLVSIMEYDNTGKEKDSSSNTCGYSSMSIVFALIVGGIMIVALVVNGCRRLDPGMPVASSCSVAISAACHLPIGQEDAALRPIMYGVVEDTEQGIGTEYFGHSIIEDQGHGHPCFSSADVTPLLAGRTYV